MKLFFGKSAAQPQVSPTDAIMKNKEAIETLTKRQDFLEKRVAQQDGLAREKAKAKDKRGATMAGLVSSGSLRHEVFKRHLVAPENHPQVAVT